MTDLTGEGIQTMSRQDNESIGITLLKAAAALCLILLALAFGTGGACGVWVTLSGLSQATHRDGGGVTGGMAIIGAGSAVVGLSGAVMLVWGVVLIFRKGGEPR